VNDLGVDVSGSAGHGRADPQGSPAERVVRDIIDAGGRAVASGHDVADWDQAGELVRLAVSSFGDLHVLVTSAGFLRDRTVAKLSEDEWDTVVRVHLKGQAAPTRHAMAYWREQARGREPADALTDRSVVQISSASGLRPGFGQANYGAAKLGIVGFCQVVALEGARLGVRANVVAPSARTRMTESDPRVVESAETDGVRFDPTAVASLIVWLAAPACPATGQLFYTDGRHLFVLGLPPIVARLERPNGWTLADFDAELPGRLVAASAVDEFLG
jgi:NAD(P)-dependent dehydrogenase (short-subunit alcohol dehydrogenase family)